jgi:serine/threonine protein kinase
LVHRDVKPANIFLCRYGINSDFAKVLDFGLVRAVEEHAPKLGVTVTQANAVMGTPAFMSPEMASTGKADARADIYAFGCVAFWLLTGRLVFEAESPLKMIVRHMTDAPARPSTCVEASFPEGLDEVVLACLEKEPEKRPASMHEVRARLARISLEDAWTNEAAEQWWRERGAEVLGKAPLELAPTEAVSLP